MPKKWPWMTESQRLTFRAVAAISAGSEPPWISIRDIYKEKFKGSQQVTPQIEGSRLSWIRVHLHLWAGLPNFVEQHPNYRENLWRLTPRGKQVAKTGEA